MSIEPNVIIEGVRSPSSLSSAVAPESIKESPTSRLMVEEPTNEMVGCEFS